ncbi:alpha/beta hydrolase [Parafilimonas terrae]|nr:alpha/beta hydrolase-fold protein [Parafilimonas terrae]
MYSENVKDSFYINVNLPADYTANKNKYPVVFLLDANLYFDIVAAILDKYSEVGLAPSVILVGIGYKDFTAMDSLRNRDDTYPIAIPEYEMSVSGGADRFLSFIDKELVPAIDSMYRTDTAKRTLMGHSLGGYFTSYALLQNLSGKSVSINNYIAASPSLHYNNYYLLDQFKKIDHHKKDNIQMYITYGGPELNESSNQPDVLKQLSEVLGKKIFFKADVYSGLDHMDTQVPTFIKGLQLMLTGNE